jgi:hypothetical protein
MAWGGSVAQVASNEIALSAQQRAAAEHELAMLQHSLQQNRENANQTRQLDQRDASQRQQQGQFNAQMQADAAREGRLGRYNDATLQLHRDEMTERAKERASSEDWRRKTFTMNEQDRKARDLMPYADDMAGQGMFGSTEDVIQHFPSLAPVAPAIAARSKAARMALESQYNADRADADVLNTGTETANRYGNMIKAERDSSWNPDNNHWWRTNQPDEAAMQGWQNSMTDINAARGAVAGDRRRMERLSPDATGKYAPSMSLPWRTNGTTTTPQPGAQVPAQQTTQFKPGMMVIQNGTTYRFDGQNWLPMK